MVFEGMSQAVLNFFESTSSTKPRRLRHRTLAAVDGVFFGNQRADGMFQVVGLFFLCIVGKKTPRIDSPTPRILFQQRVTVFQTLSIPIYHGRCFDVGLVCDRYIT